MCKNCIMETPDLKSLSTNHMETDCGSCKSRPIEFNCKEVRTQAEEPNSYNCGNRTSNHFLV